MYEPGPTVLVRENVMLRLVELLEAEGFGVEVRSAEYYRRLAVERGFDPDQAGSGETFSVSKSGQLGTMIVETQDTDSQGRLNKISTGGNAEIQGALARFLFASGGQHLEEPDSGLKPFKKMLVVQQPQIPEWWARVGFRNVVTRRSLLHASENLLNGEIREQGVRLQFYCGYGVDPDSGQRKYYVALDYKQPWFRKAALDDVIRRIEELFGN